MLEMKNPASGMPGILLMVNSKMSFFAFDLHQLKGLTANSMICCYYKSHTPSFHVVRRRNYLHLERGLAMSVQDYLRFDFKVFDRNYILFIRTKSRGRKLYDLSGRIQEHG